MKIEDIVDYNEWWETGKVPERLLMPQKRDLFRSLRNQIERKQISILVGMRRVGKTTLLYQLIDYLIKNGVKPKNILYFSFDEYPEVRVRDALEIYEREILLKRLKDVKTKVYIFLDEIQKVKGWEGEVKKIYDLNYNVKFFISGSSSLRLRKNTKETLAGRTIENILPPLSFKEFLKIKGVKKIDKKIEHKKLLILFEEYVKKGGFPEFVNEENLNFIYNQIKEIVVDRIIYQDIPDVFNTREPNKVMGIVKLIASNPGMIINYETVARDFNTTRQTISNILDYLEETFLIKRLYNFSKNFLVSERKLKKWYPCDHGIINAYGRGVEKGKIIETVIVNYLNARFFWRTPQKDEVDVIEEKLIPIEVKYKSSISKSDTKSLVKFCKKFGVKKGVMVTKDIKRVENVDGVKIEFIPIEEFLLK